MFSMVGISRYTVLIRLLHSSVDFLLSNLLCQICMLFCLNNFFNAVRKLSHASSIAVLNRCYLSFNGKGN